MRIKLRVAIYIRVSTLDQARDGYSLSAQEKVLLKFAADNGYFVYKVYRDAGISGKDIDHRPAMLELLHDAAERKFDVVLFWALSRFTRSIVDLYTSIDYLGKYDVTIRSYTESFDTRSVFGRFAVGLLGLIAQLERELTAERVRAAMLERAQQGKRTCNEVLGYDRCGKDTIAVNPLEAAQVLFIYEKYETYRNLTAVAALCNEMGYRGKRGRVLTPWHIKVILSRPIYAGYYSYAGNIYKGDFEAIVSPERFDRVQRLLKTKTLKERFRFAEDSL